MYEYPLGIKDHQSAFKRALPSKSLVLYDSRIQKLVKKYWNYSNKYKRPCKQSTSQVKQKNHNL